MAMAALYVLHAIYAVVWMWPVRSTDFGPIVGTMTAGAVLAQPALMAWLGILAPGRLGMRLVISGSLAVIMGYAMIIGGSNSDGVVRQMHVLEMVSVVSSYPVFLLPALALKRLRQWQLVPATNPFDTRRQFSIAGLLMVTAWIAAVLGTGRWMWSFVDTRTSSGLGLEQWIFAGIVATMIAWCCLPMVPLTALVLDGRRARATVALLATVAVTQCVLYLIIYRVSGARDFWYFGTMIVGAHVSALASLLIIRWSGFRLVRETLLRRAQSGDNPLGE